MKTLNYLFALTTSIFLITGCSKKDSSPEPPEVKGSYILYTTDWGTAPDWIGSGYFGTYATVPSGTVNNIGEQSAQANSYGGFSVYKQWTFVRADADDNSGITRYALGADGKLAQDAFIKAEHAKFLIVDDHTGFYYDTDRGSKKIQKFDPTTMKRTGEINLDLPEVTQGWANVYVGYQTIAAKEGKLFVSVTYSPKGGDGFLDNTKDYTMAVIDIATEKFEKLISYAGTKNQGYPASEHPMFLLGSDGSLYFLTRPDRVIENEEWIEDGTSMFFRIKKGETDFDQNWSLKTSDFGMPLDNYWFSSMDWYGDRLWVDIGTWDNFDKFAIYSIDTDSKQYQKISGLPSLAFGHTAGNIQASADGKLYFRVEGEGESTENAFYQLNADGTSASKLFDVSGGGTVRKFVYLKE